MTDELYRKLTRLKRIEMELTSIRVDIEELETHLLPSAIKYDKDAVQVSPDDNISKVLATIADLETKYNSKYAEYNLEMRRLSCLLDQLEPQQSIVMKYKYIKQMKISDIADKLNYSEQNIFRINRIAVKNLEELIKSV